MAEAQLCKICGKRRPKRSCPAVAGNICSLCCGTEREVSLHCPLDCMYLIEARRRETLQPSATGDKQAFPEIEVTEEMIRNSEELLLFCVYSLVQAAQRTEGAVDSDVVSALAAAIQTQKTLSSGLVYETRAENAIAARIQRSMEKSLRDYAEERDKQDSLHPLRDSDVLAILVFLYRVAQEHQNGRPRGRHFIDVLREMTPEGAPPPPEVSLLV